MVKEIKIPDLDAPKAILINGEKDRLSQKWHLWIASYAASMIYALLHKLVIPLTLKVLHTNKQAYTHISVDIIWILALGLSVHLSRRLSPLTQFFAGATLSFAIIEILKAAVEKNQGWITVSSYIASVPLMFCTFNLYLFAKRKSYGLYLLLGVAAFVSCRLLFSEYLWIP